MFGLIIFIFVLSFVVRLFTRPFYGYYRPWIYPYSGFGLWGMGMGRPYGPMYFGHHHHHHMGYGPMGCWRRW